MHCRGVLAVGALLVGGMTPTSVVPSAHAGARTDVVTAVPAAPATSEADDFRFPGADVMQVGDLTYAAYGATTGDRKAPYTTFGYDRATGTFERRSTIDGDAWGGYPKGYQGYRDAKHWTPAVYRSERAGQAPWYYMIYGGQVRKGHDQRCLYAATSRHWDRGFRALRRPILCPGRGRYAIDADVAEGPGGKTWLTFRNGAWTSGSYTAVGVAPLHLRGRSVSLGRLQILLSNGPRTLRWTYHHNAEKVKTVENPVAVSVGGRWYLFYSGNNWRSNRYATGLAFCGRRLGDDRCTPVRPRQAYFAYAPRVGKGFAEALPPRQRYRRLPGNRRGPGSLDVFTDPDGRRWAAWNYITDGTPDPAQPDRRTRIAPLSDTGAGATRQFAITWTRP